MTDAPIADLDTLPKVELHVHLEGTITADTATALARRHGDDPDAVLGLQDGAYPARYRDFLHFVEVFLATSGQVRTPDDLAAVAAAFAGDQARRNVLYTEVTFTAVTMVERGMEPAAMWRALREGFAEVADTRIGLVIDTPRDLGPAAAQRSIALVDAADAPIVALGLTGIEGSYPASDFAMLRTAADDLGLGLTVHAGETGPASEVRDALDDLGADRIGHGIATASDDDLLARVARDGVPLEVCPTSNVTLGLVPDLSAHPLPQLLRAGATVVIGSDDPPFFTTTITHELEHAARLGGLDRHGVLELQRTAARAAFAPDDLRAELVRRIDAWEADATG